MIDGELPKSLPEVLMRLGAETYTFHTDALEGYDILIMERST